MADSQIQPAAEFQALPLEFIIASPLIGVVKAQSMAASTTIAFLNSFKNDTVEFAYKTQQTAGKDSKAVNTTVKAPLLSLVPVPHLKIDSLTVNFKYEISQVVKSTNDKSMDAGLEIGTTGLLSKFISGTLKGNVSSKSSDESVMNRSGVLEITMHASESEMPEGLAKILNLLAKSIDPPTENK